MRDIVFLFGAGASFGAGGILPESPPLGAQLYSELARIYPSSWGALPQVIRSKFQGNFEVGMEEVFQRWGTAIPQLMREMAIYFIQFRPASERCFYRVLIRRMRESGLENRVIFATLNYDCVLEFSLVQEGLSVAYFEGIPQGSVPVWKLHGSSNFFSHGLQVSPGVLYSTGIAFEGGLQALGSIDDVVRHCLVETALAPAMSLYMRGKPLAISPSTICALQDSWTRAANSASKVIVVGVHPNSEDRHIWDPLASTTAEVLFVGSREGFEEWKPRREARTTTFLGSTLADAGKLIMQILK